jgi:hypothetical protein
MKIRRWDIQRRFRDKAVILQPEDRHRRRAGDTSVEQIGSEMKLFFSCDGPKDKGGDEAMQIFWRFEAFWSLFG